MPGVQLGAGWQVCRGRGLVRNLESLLRDPKVTCPKKNQSAKRCTPVLRTPNVVSVLKRLLEAQEKKNRWRPNAIMSCLVELLMATGGPDHITSGLQSA